MTYHLNDKNSLTALYYISPGSGILNDSSRESNPAWLTDQYARSQAFAGNWHSTPSATRANEVRVGYSHYYQSFPSADATESPANYSFNGSTYNFYTGQNNTTLYGGFPALSLSTLGSGSGGSAGGLGASWPKTVGPDGVLQFTDHISYLRGKHAFMFGGEILNNQSESDVTANAKGPITFASLLDYFQGFPDGLTAGVPNTSGKGSASILTGSLLRHFAYSGYAAFFQDDWRVKPRVTLNLGLRYELNTVPVERNGLQGNFDPNSSFGVTQVGFGSLSPYNGDHNNFSPRLGIAWDVFGTGRTVIRAGGGILYEQLSLDVLNGIGNSAGLRATSTGLTVCSAAIAGTCAQTPGDIGVVNIGFANTPIITGASTAFPNGETPGAIPFNWANNSPTTALYNFVPYCGDANTAVPAGLPNAGYKPAQCNVIAATRNLRTPYVENYTLDVQHAITHNLSIDVGYVGNHGTKLLSALDVNQPSCSTPGITPCATGSVGPGWDTTAVTNCLNSAGTGYNSCAPDTNNERLARPFASKFPYFKYIDQFGNNDVSSYNSLQATLTARGYHGLTLTAGYTYSHALGDASDQGTGGGNYVPINSYGDIRSELYAPTSFDIRHRGTVSATYAVPEKKGYAQMLEGWSLNGVAILQSGSPWGFSDVTTDFSGTGEQASSTSGGAAATMGGQWDLFGDANDFKATKAQELSGIPYYAGTSNATCLAKSTAMGQRSDRVPHESRLLPDGKYGLGPSGLRQLRHHDSQYVL